MFIFKEHRLYLLYFRSMEQFELVRPVLDGRTRFELKGCNCREVFDRYLREFVLLHRSFSVPSIQREEKEKETRNSLSRRP